MTALHLAAQSDHVEMARLLLERGADLTVEDAIYHGMPAGWAAHFGSARVQEPLDIGRTGRQAVTAPVTIRRATAADAAAILDCLRCAFETYRESYTPDAYRDTVLTPETICDRLASMSVLVAVAPDGTIVGTLSHQDTGHEEGHLRGMGILPAYQGTGVAEQLLATAERELRDQQCARVSLDTTEPLRRAVRFYEKHGYRASGRVTQFFGMPLFEYVKELNHG